MTTAPRRALRAPVLHFLLLGGALFALRAALPAPPAPDAAGGAAGAAVQAAAPAAQDPTTARDDQSRTVVISAAQVARLRDGFLRGHQAPPSAAEEARLIDRLVEEEMLYREALAHGLDGAAPVRQRLIQNMHFLRIDEGGGATSLYAAALEIGFDRTDPVVRRFLVEQMRMLARAGRAPDLFTDTELLAHLRRHAARFALPAAVRLSHAYLDADRRGEATEGDARALLARLRTEGVDAERAPSLGDPFFPGHHPALASHAELAKLYGGDFAAAALRLPAGRWYGPLRSAYGLHLVWVHETVPGELPRLADVRSRLALELAHERQEARLAAFVRDLRGRYLVRVERPGRAQAEAP